jgi:uncharacterized protein (DUF1499 family)
MKGARSAKTAYWLGLAGTGVGALAAYGSGWGLWPFTLGLLGTVAGTVLAIIAVLAGLIALIRKPDGLRRHAMIGILAAIPMLVTAGWAINRGTSNPPIHEVTTDLVNLPQFPTLKTRDDRFAGLKGGEAEWRDLHAKAYGDIKPIMLALPANLALQKAEAAAKELGWVVSAKTETTLEATDTVSPFKFKDDVVIRITPDGGGSVIDVRSISRVGQSDLGYNAERVRAVLAAMQKG